ncbi:MAG: methyltransferase domain-containing protein [Candidatus Lokiarchaeota archaeon]|nr:methyltransferase domain-containing protein [Candidatus Lokiarchaeota archaeon]
MLEQIKWAYPNLNRMLRGSFVRNKKLISFLEVHLDKIVPDNILEVGCGTGRMTKFLNKKYRDKYLICIDYKQESIDLLKKSFKARQNLKILNKDINEFSNNKNFDLIIGFQIYPFLKNPRNSFSNMINLLEEDGLLFLLEMDMRKVKTNIFLESDKKFYHDYLRGLEIYGVHYDFERINDYLNDLELNLEIEFYEYLQKEVIEINKTLIKKMSILKTQTEYLNEIAEFYLQFLEPFGWNREDVHNYFVKSFTFECYKNHIGKHLIRNTPYYLYIIGKRTT